MLTMIIFKINTLSIRLFLPILVFALLPTPSVADGFAIKDQSPTMAGTSYASAVSTVEDTSVIFFNPAGLTYLKRNNFFAAFSAISTTSKLKSSSGTRPTLLGGGPTGGASTDRNTGLNAVVPVVYGSMDLTEDLKVGYGINSPFGMATSFTEGWQGRFHAVTSKLKTINFNPVLAYRLSDKLSIGGGLQIAYADTRLSNAILTTTGEGFIEFVGDDFGFGWTMGILAEPIKGTRFGISYRSHISHLLKGKATVTPAIGATVEVGANGALDLPETVRLGISQDIGSQFSLHVGAAWRRWSRIKENLVRFDTPVSILSSATSISTNADWKNTWFLSAGATYKPTPEVTFRIGVGHDESPIPDATRGPGNPGTNGIGLTFGSTYRISDWIDVTIAYTHVFFDNATISLVNPSTGNLSAEFETNVDILSVQCRFKF